jgi:hypothetical protein
MKMKEMHAEKVKKVYTYTPEHARAALERLGIATDLRQKMIELNSANELDISGLRNVL